MKNKVFYSIISIVFLGLQGCQTTKNLDPENNISVQKALLDISDGVAQMKDNLDKKKTVMGVYIDEITVNLALSGKAVDGGEAGISVDLANIKSLSKSPFSIEAGTEYSRELGKGSTITIKFANIAGLDLKNRMLDKEYLTELYKADVAALAVKDTSLKKQGLPEKKELPKPIPVTIFSSPIHLSNEDIQSLKKNNIDE